MAFNGFFMALLVLSLYIHLGDYTKIDFTKTQDVIAWTFNLNGLAFLFSNSISFSSSSSVILQMPL